MIPTRSARVSIVIPAFNAEAWIERSIRSALGQTWPTLEVIVVDDGSTDGTGRLLDRLAGCVTVIHQENRGAAAARNAGAHRSSGRFVCFLDADDELLPDAIEQLVGAFEALPGVGVISAPHLHRVADGSMTRRPESGRVLGPDRLVGEVDYFRVARTEVLATVGTVLVSREALSAAGPFPEGMPVAEDLLMWARLAGRARWGFVDREVLVYHHGPASSVTMRERSIEALTTIAFIMTETEMRSRLRPATWQSYRLYRRDVVLHRCRELVRLGERERAREALRLVPPAPINLPWLVALGLAIAPDAALDAVLRAYRRSRSLGRLRVRSPGPHP